MAKSIENLACKHVQTLVPYESARRIGSHGHVLLNANESPKSEFYIFNSTTLNRYPDAQPFGLLHNFADYVGNGIKPDNVIVSRGSDETIGLIIRAFCEQDEGILIAPPTYGMYEIAAKTNNVKVAYAKRGENFSLKAKNIIEAIDSADFKVKAVFIDSPANPLGEIFPLSELEILLQEKPEVFFVMDEAYIEYAKDKTSIPLLAKYNNLIVLHTLSKAFALAGIRCGFAIAHKEVITMLNKVIDPYPIPDPCVQIAKQALASGGISLMQERVAKCILQREELRAHLNGLDYVEYVFPSDANFLLVKFKDGPKVFEYCKSKGITLRSFETKEGLKNTVRITIGSADELNELMRALSSMPQ